MTILEVFFLYKMGLYSNNRSSVGLCSILMNFKAKITRQSLYVAFPTGQKSINCLMSFFPFSFFFFFTTSESA